MPSRGFRPGSAGAAKVAKAEAEWNAAKHPRDPGGEGGGQFVHLPGASGNTAIGEAAAKLKDQNDFHDKILGILDEKEQADADVQRLRAVPRKVITALAKRYDQRLPVVVLDENSKQMWHVAGLSIGNKIKINPRMLESTTVPWVTLHDGSP